MSSSVPMYPVSIDEVIAKPKVMVDLYVRVPGPKHFLISKAGMPTPTEHLAKYKAKGVDYLYIQEEDFLKLVQESISIAGIMMAQKSVPDVTKMLILQDAVSAVHNEIDQFGLTSVAFEHVMGVTESTMVLVACHEGIGKLVEDFSKLNEPSIKHSMMVSVVAAMLGRAHNWVKPATLEKLALIGLLHDIGKLKVPVEILKKKWINMSRDEQVIFQSHTEIGRQMVEQMKSVPDDVSLALFEHHELSDGTGYPRGLKDFQISPLARVAALANAFCEACEKYSQTDPRTAAQNALNEIVQRRAGQFNKDAVRALKTLLQDTVKAAS